jgi:hypothetical protein
MNFSQRSLNDEIVESTVTPQSSANFFEGGPPRPRRLQQFLCVAAGVARPPGRGAVEQRWRRDRPQQRGKALGIEMGAPWHLHRDHLKAAGVITMAI